MKKRDIIGISIAGGLCILLGIASMIVPTDAQTPVMFASYGAGYVAFMWALYSAYQRFMVGSQNENAASTAALVSAIDGDSAAQSEGSSEQ